MQMLGTIQNDPVNGSTEVAASNPTPQENRQVTPPPDATAYNKSFPSSNPQKPMSSSSEPTPSNQGSNAAESLLGSEIQEISEEELFNNFVKVQDFARSCLELRIPRSLKKDFEGIVDRIQGIRKEYEETKSLPITECLTVKASPLPNFSRTSSTDQTKITKKPTKKKHQPISITSHISRSTSQSNQAPSNPNQQTDQSSTETTNASPAGALEHPPNQSNNPSTDPANDEGNVAPTALDSVENKVESQTQSVSHPTGRVLHLTSARSHKSTPPPSGSPQKRKRKNSRCNPCGTSASTPKSRHHSDSSSLSNADSKSDYNEDSDDDPDHQSAPPASNLDNTNGQPPARSSSAIDPNTFSLVKPDSIREEIHRIANTFLVGRVKKEKWQIGWTAMEYFLNARLSAPDITKIPTANFIYQKAKFDYEKWIKDIMNSGSNTLSHYEHEIWYCKDVFDMESVKEQTSSAHPIIPLIPINKNKPHPETKLFRCLIALLNLPHHQLLREWAKTVALSIQTVSDESPKAPQVDSAPTALRRHVIVLSWLNSLKDDTMPSLLQITNDDDASQEDPDASKNTPVSFPSDSLEKLRKIIIGMMMSYTIIQAHAVNTLKNPNPCKKQKVSSSQAISKTAASDRKSITQIKSQQNHFPLVLYLLSGIRGIFCATRDHRQNSISDCLEIFLMFQEIHQQSKTQSSAHEEIWINLGTYIRQIISSIRNAPDDPSKVIVPTRHKLALCIAHDYLNFSNHESNPTVSS
ncbi:hypothetical protein PCANC_25291 [Puccinia coronata f. sp. avenae]|uniref:Uncharacterized protein n=1 Tax=Puccinia coronata f. sp. avenae TaxID=200324 RepID=A0A2N5TWV2_9BASI|nr:hypothetical protein PCANC_25291 [Puccinia coronata f. sp. avenae]